MKDETGSMRHFLDLKDFSTDTLQGILNEAVRMKTHMKQFGQHEQPLAGKTVAMIFEKPSTRTRVSFEVGIIQLGGSPWFFQQMICSLDAEKASKIQRVCCRGMSTQS